MIVYIFLTIYHRSFVFLAVFKLVIFLQFIFMNFEHLIKKCCHENFGITVNYLKVYETVTGINVSALIFADKKLRQNITKLYLRVLLQREKLKRIYTKKKS